MKKLFFSLFTVSLLTTYGYQLYADSHVIDSEGFTTIFNGQNLDGWRGYCLDTIPEGWCISDGCMFFDAHGGASKGKDIIFDKQYEDFELRFEWKVEKGSNSGVFYHVKEIDGCSIYMVAPEYQIRDKSAKGPLVRQSAALYDMIEASSQNANPTGEWNTGAIKVHNGNVTHYQNGIEVVHYSLASQQWIDLLESSKFNSKNAPTAFSHLSSCGKKGHTGFIGFQDHGTKVWIRNVRIKELDNKVKYVDPFIGTHGGGNVFPGAAFPFGMVKMGPVSASHSSQYSGKGSISGYSHTNLSGVGGGAKYGNIVIFPFSRATKMVPIPGYEASRSDERAVPGYYTVFQKEDSIRVEMTCSKHCGFHRYVFLANHRGSNILFDAGSILSSGNKEGNAHNETQTLVGSEIKILSPTELSGYCRARGGWNAGGAYTVYFYAVTDKAAVSACTWKNGELHNNSHEEFDSGKDVGAWLNFGNEKKVEVRIGISYISEGKAKENYMKEASDVSFGEALSLNQKNWDNLLSRIDIEGTDDQKIRFYTALYHTMLMPSDKTGENPKWTSSEPYYDDFYCLWDTFRTSFPLYSLVYPEKYTSFARSLIDIWKHDGYMPDGRSGDWNGRTQGGSNADMVIAEGILKDIPGFDYEEGLLAMLKDAEVAPGGTQRQEGRGGLDDYKRLGYVSTSYERAGTRTVEYCANDASLAFAAKKLGYNDLYEKYISRAEGWKKLWDNSTVSDGCHGFIMPKDENGKWDRSYKDVTAKHFISTPDRFWGLSSHRDIPDGARLSDTFGPLTGGSWASYFYEGTSWDYSFYVPHDVEGLIKMCGGRNKFIKRLDVFFANNYFNIRNEPGFLTPYLYIWAGRHDKTEALLLSLLDKHYTIERNGIPGNDDSGAMSSWMIFNSIGLFPVAGQDLYLITVPQLPKAVLDSGDGHILTIEAEGLTDRLKYVKSVFLDGKALDSPFISHSSLRSAHILHFEMSEVPTGWGCSL